MLSKSAGADFRQTNISMLKIIQLTGQELLDKIVAVFDEATDREVTPGKTVASFKLPFAAYLKAIRTLDLDGAFIPESKLKDPSLTLQDLAAASESFQVQLFGPPPSTWDRVRDALSQAGAMPAAKIRSNTSLQQIGVGSNWLPYLDDEFERQGLRFFDADFKKAATADDVYQKVAAFLDKKTVIAT